MSYFDPINHPEMRSEEVNFIVPERIREACIVRDIDYKCAACQIGISEQEFGMRNSLTLALAALREQSVRENPKPPTNADLIRGMSDEELAVTLMCPNEMGMAEIPCDRGDDKNCCACLLDWLRQPTGDCP